MPRRAGGVQHRGPTWRARWYDAAGRRQSASFDTKAEAEAFLAERTVELARGGTASMDGRRTTLAEWWERWQAGHQVSLLTRRREQSVWECWVAPHLARPVRVVQFVHERHHGDRSKGAPGRCHRRGTA